MTQGAREKHKKEEKKFYHLFVNSGILESLASVLERMVKYRKEDPKGFQETDDDDVSYITKIAKIFSAFSTGDDEIRRRLAQPEVNKKIINAMEMMTPSSKEYLILLNNLKAIVNVKSAVPLAIYIKPLMSVLNPYVQKKEFVPELFNPATVILLNLVNKTFTQEEERIERHKTAIECGIVEFLEFVIQEKTQLKEFAIFALSCLPTHSAKTRTMLLSKNVLEFYLQLLDMSGMSSYYDVLLQAIASFVQWERIASERILLKPKSIAIIKKIYANIPDHMLQNLLELLKKLMTCSKNLLRALATPDFVSYIKTKLNFKQPHVRVILLDTLRSLMVGCGKLLKPNFTTSYFPT